MARPGPPGGPPHDLFGYYPSGHTTTAAVCLGTLALVAARRHRARRIPLLGAAVLWTTLVGAAMVIHRYHWPTDVLAGFLLGTLLLTLVDRLPDPGFRSAPGARGVSVGGDRQPDGGVVR